MAVPATAFRHGGLATTPDGAVYVTIDPSSSPTFVDLTLTGQIFIAEGSDSAPSIASASQPTTGWNFSGNSSAFSAAGTPAVLVSGTGVGFRPTVGVYWLPSESWAGTADLFLYRGGDGILEQRNSTTVQEQRWYSTYTSSSSYHRQSRKSAKTTLSAVSGATVTATNLIPDGAFLIGVTTRINTALGTGNSTTGYTVGDGSDADLWGVVGAVTAGTASGSSSFTAAGASGTLYTSAQSVVITAVGGNFDGTGAIEVCAHYDICEAD